MRERTILVGKSYRAPDGEVRVVESLDDGEIRCRALSAMPDPA